MKILLLSPYNANSHQHWWRLLKQYFNTDTWTVLTLPARYFNWRIRSNSLTWSRDQRDVLTQHYDLCIATSMTDLATLRGLLPSLAKIPTVLYFHENQVAYPVSNKADKQNVHASGVVNSIEPLMVQLYSSLAADHLCFNSDYNRNSYFKGLTKTLKKFPDGVPKGIVAELENKSSVIPVPIDRKIVDQERIEQGKAEQKTNEQHQLCRANNTFVNSETINECKKPTFVWNHRWEYDKGPARLLAFIHALPSRADLTLHILGQSFRQIPVEFDEIKQVLQNRGWLGRWGYISDTQEYHQILDTSTFVLSTAEHDFQGLSVLEAVSRGCIPIVPDRLAYCEMFDDIYRYPSDVNTNAEAEHMAKKTQSLIDTLGIRAPSVSRFYIHNLGPEYQKLFSTLA